MTAGRRRRDALVTLGLVLLGVAAFHEVRPDELVLDAVTLIRDNPRVRGEVAWGELWRSNYWGSFASDGQWRPLTLASFRLEYVTLGFGDRPTGYVVVNLVLHLLVTLLLWRAGTTLSGSRFLGGCAAALFAVHPAATEVVPNVVGWADLLVAASLLGSLLLWERYRSTGRVLWLVAVVVVWGLGLLAKESAVVVPAAVVLWDLARAGRRDLRAVADLLRARAVPYAVLAAVGLAWLWYRGVLLTPFGPAFDSALNNPLVLESASVRALNGVALLGSYLAQALWPVRLCADYSFTSLPVVRSVVDPRLLLGLLGVVVLLVAAAFALGRRPEIAFGCPLFLGALLPVCNLLSPIGTIRGDRLLYLPLVGLALAVAGLLDVALSRVRHTTARRAARAAAVALPVLAMLAVTVPRTRVWRSNLALWQDTVAKAPDNAKARHNLARVLLDRVKGATPEDLREVLPHLERAVTLARGLPGDEFLEPWVNLGTVELRIAAGALDQGRMTEPARQWLERAAAVLEEGVRRSGVHGRRYAWWQRAVEARAPGLGGARPAFGDVRLHLALASALDALGRPDEARGQLRRALEVDPTSPTPYLRLALIYAREGQLGYVRTLVAVASRLPHRSREDEALLALLGSR